LASLISVMSIPIYYDKITTYYNKIAVVVANRFGS
jgi:hypothetical protein